MVGLLVWWIFQVIVVILFDDIQNNVNYNIFILYIIIYKHIPTNKQKPVTSNKRLIFENDDWFYAESNCTFSFLYLLSTCTVESGKS